ATPAPKHEVAGDEYRVEAGDTLSGIARAVRSDESANINQLMLALLKQNPNAFFKDNINALKRGAILRIPSADQIKAVGSAGAAAAAVHAQIEDWRGGAAAKPTLVADTGTPAPAPKKPSKPAPAATTSAASSTKGSERLELVPPKAGKESLAMNDRPGGSAGGTSASTEVKAELARTKEALTSREQEASELKSRVKELEETKTKTDRLLGLKDSEIADLQRQLKDLRAQEAKEGSKATPSAAAAAPAAKTAPLPAASSPAGKVSKEDIWGTASTSSEAKPATTTPSAPASPASAPASEASTAPKESATAPAASTAKLPEGSATPSTSAEPSTTPPAATPATSPAPPSDTGAAPASSPPAATSPASTPAETPAASAKPASTAPIKSEAKTKMHPLPSHASEWYEQSWVKPAAIGAAALLLLAGLLGLRKRKPAAATARGSIAGAFGDSPIGGAAASADAEERTLREQLAEDPGNVGLHLELLSLLYAERNVAAFEDAAAAMHAQVVDPHQPEWLEARAMGQELAPHNPLFFEEPATDEAFDDEAFTAPHATPTFDHDEVFGHTAAQEPAPPTSTAFDFDLDAEETPPARAPAVPASETTFSFDDLPPVDFTSEARHEVEASAPLPVEEDEFAGEDGVGTKLDLAKAYLDMGDPEGARSMLEEVLAEGNDAQKGEARRLMGEIR
ncbi:MAG TPA: FimV/HubP family polar landmark protein, partial [Rhodanobacteraceae bacterium]|nr:FimV/HubP family polar landmark protein [Rhodanobacteraceae bacterium]